MLLPGASFPVVCVSRQRRGIQYQAWGNAPGFMEAQTSALKARFTAGQVQKLDESRFQRLFTGQSNSWGDAPGYG
jgi:hypothetical protein